MSDIKLDLTKFQEKEVDDDGKVIDKPVIPVEELSEQPVDETVDETVDKTVDEPIMVEVTDDLVDTPVEETIDEPVDTPIDEHIEKEHLPEGVDSLVKFIKDTGGTVEDYVRLNADYTNIDENTLLKEYYKKTRSHLDNDEVDFLIEENFSYDEDLDESRDIKKKKLAKKEEIAKARKFLDTLKTEYYKEIKTRPTVTNEQKKAVEFFDRYSKNEEQRLKDNKSFSERTKKMFTEDFKGFDFDLGEKKFRYGIKEPQKVAENQSEINNVLRKFLDKDGKVNDMKGYHKALYAATNADTIANHFYEQGKADAIKDVAKKSKNIQDGQRNSPESLTVGGFKVKVVDGVDSSKLKIKTRI